MKDRIIKWSHFLRKTREWLESEGFIEVVTDTMVSSSAIDYGLDTIKVSHSCGEYELHTSAEFEMKWILSHTSLPIYQIGKVYRDDPLTSIHKKEFTMLEYYRVGSTIEDTSVDLKKLISFLSGNSLQFDEYTVADLVKQMTGVNIFSDLETFTNEVRELGISLSAQDSWDDVFFKLMIEKVEPIIGKERPVILKDFPKSLASLAVVEGSPPVAKRFEIYWKGMELSNGFNELLDVKEMHRRVASQNELRVSQGKKEHACPNRLIEAMEKGLPASSGVAVGMDRLFSAIHGFSVS